MSFPSQNMRSAMNVCPADAGYEFMVNSILVSFGKFSWVRSVLFDFCHFLQSPRLALVLILAGFFFTTISLRQGEHDMQQF